MQPPDFSQASTSFTVLAGTMLLLAPARQSCRNVNGWVGKQGKEGGSPGRKWKQPPLAMWNSFRFVWFLLLFVFSYGRILACTLAALMPSPQFSLISRKLLDARWRLASECHCLSFIGTQWRPPDPKGVSRERLTPQKKRPEQQS